MLMNLYAVVDKNDIVQNVIVWDGKTKIGMPAHCFAVPCEGKPAHVGWPMGEEPKPADPVPVPACSVPSEKQGKPVPEDECQPVPNPDTKPPKKPKTFAQASDFILAEALEPVHQAPPAHLFEVAPLPVVRAPKPTFGQWLLIILTLGAWRPSVRRD